MKAFVLGHKGMLGHVVSRYLRGQGIEVQTTEARYEGRPDDALIKEVEESGTDWIINSIGKIKQKSSDRFDLFLGNSLLPVHLKSILQPAQKLIHASTDCVFSGRRGKYRCDEKRDAEDVYGLSKILGEVVAERGKCQIIRTSIIGPEIATGSGLMGWFLTQQGPVNGFTNHFWNGITTLEWAKIAFEIIAGRYTPESAILQVGSEQPVSKYELLKLIGEIWPHRIAIAPKEASERIDRTLIPVLTRGVLERQLRDLRAWY